jgi:hypothetical protein
MIAAPVETETWTRHRRLTVILILVVIQVGLIYWLGARKEVPRRTPAAEPTIRLFPGRIVELPGLSDPTLFVLASPHGFSAAAWLKVPLVEYHLAEIPEPPRPLKRPEQLGGALSEFVQNNLSKPLEVAGKPEPQVDAVDFSPFSDLAARQSTLVVEGELAGRKLLTELKLNSWPSAEILSNSVMQVAVDTQGRVFSPVLLYGCGSKEADASAYALAASARFMPVRRGGPGEVAASPDPLIWGRLVFHWQTSPIASTNAAGATP